MDSLLRLEPMAIVIESTTEEQQFKEKCLKNGIFVPEADETRYDDEEQPIYPVYYTIDITKAGIIAMWDICLHHQNKLSKRMDGILDRGYSLISLTQFSDGFDAYLNVPVAI